MWALTKAFGIWPCLFIAFAASVSAVCECGFSVAVDPVGDSSFSVFTELFETDFLHSTNLADAHWLRQQYSVNSSDSRGPYGKNFTTSDVVTNPLKDPYSWAGDSIHGGDAGLQLWAREPINSMIPAAEISANRTDILYGSFRVGMKMSKVNGTCGAFFWFRNDSQEIDMEFLSSEFHLPSNPNTGAVNLVVQTPASLQAGYDASGTPDFVESNLTFSPDTAFHEYRFDWSPGRVAFYADSYCLHIMNVSIPNSPGDLVLNHWSNGDPKWSGGPPAADTAVTVSYVKAYFNSTDPAKQADYRKRCPTYNVKKTCAVPEQRDPPDPAGPNGNETAKTYFFSLDHPPATSGCRAHGMGVAFAVLVVVLSTVRAVRLLRWVCGIAW
ncbi:concanavalin A-like lectin/glucanase [Mytilinidion resinicola]|uniref:Concanavalin A-like lectin/glucanase n=1 Tax=Mytilinidion resinicola TaxID=574789 RepID=A0A6A6YDG3_9PEZI|nr:concanavalin A-like lectin/glucanase [Mytilinidion resinicola]KAF2806563.1 concanavalin A-like lectin/glucanase [Mytilinidion resinicola]